MPQIGQAPGVALTISGCIGQVHSTDAALVVRGPASGVRGALPRVSWIGAETADIERGPRASQPCGSLANLVRQPGEQNQYVVPA
jgi:hypothetical protein